MSSHSVCSTPSRAVALRDLHPIRMRELMRQLDNDMSTSGLSVRELESIYALDSIKQFGPQKFKQLHEAGLDPAQVLDDHTLLPIEGKRGEQFRGEIAEMTGDARGNARARAERQLERARELRATILTYRHPCYPANVFHSNNPVPVLYARGNCEVLKSESVVACVGSRRIRPPYSRVHEVLASGAARAGFAIGSGFALGADTIGHRAAFESGGRTICVLPGGVDRPFPPENDNLWNQLLEYPGAVMMSEFAFGTGASKLTLRKRNKLIVACARAIFVSQSALNGGAMNAYRFAREQKKLVATCETDCREDTSGNAKIGEELRQDDALFTADTSGQEFVDWLQGSYSLI